MSCHFCYNAYAWAKEPHEDEDYFDGGLHDENDFSSSTIGFSDGKHQFYINSGGGRAINIEACEWYNGRWHTIGYYFPKFCPECGRKLDEYIIDERGTQFTKKREDTA